MQLTGYEIASLAKAVKLLKGLRHNSSSVRVDRAKSLTENERRWLRMAEDCVFNLLKEVSVDITVSYDVEKK